MKNRKGHKTFLKLLASLASLLALSVIAFFIYVSIYYKAGDYAKSSLESQEISISITDDLIVFRAREDSDTGLIFYPGGKVEYTAYAPLMEKLAEEGINCFLLKVPYNLAFLDIDKADSVRKEESNIKRWYVGGHSLGGSAASSYLKYHSDEYEGLILLASYSTEDFSQSRLKVISIYGSEDRVLNAKRYLKFKANLPDNLNEYVIEGGCHAFFGNYGYQKGDGNPVITVEEQTDITAAYILESIEGLN